MLLLTMVFGGLSAIIHVYIFVLESVAWDRAATRKAFGIRNDAEAAATRPLAFNQGFYNLFLALMVALGMVLFLAGNTVAGATLFFAGTGSMVAAGLVLLISNPKLAKAAFIQFTAPALGIILGLFALTP